jgi:hypothetical protein
LLLTTLDGNAGVHSAGVFAGYTVRGGVGSRLVDSTRTVTSRQHGYPLTLEVAMTDEAGRVTAARGRTLNRYANWATPGSFAWMSMVEWEVDGVGTVIGEDQEVWAPDRLGPTLQALNT